VFKGTEIKLIKLNAAAYCFEFIFLQFVRCLSVTVATSDGMIC